MFWWLSGQSTNEEEKQDDCRYNFITVILLLYWIGIRKFWIEKMPEAKRPFNYFCFKAKNYDNGNI